jgi:hypothetical protein
LKRGRAEAKLEELKDQKTEVEASIEEAQVYFDLAADKISKEGYKAQIDRLKEEMGEIRTLADQQKTILEDLDGAQELAKRAKEIADVLASGSDADVDKVRAAAPAMEKEFKGKFDEATKLKDATDKTIADITRQLNLLGAKEIDGTTEKGKRDIKKIAAFNKQLLGLELTRQSAADRVAAIMSAYHVIGAALA